MRVSAAFLALLFGSFLAAGSADAAVRSYFVPKLDGERLAFCASSGQHCGKPVADAWCRYNGFSDALLFQREALLQPEARALYADTGDVCTGEACLSFREIKCRGTT